MKQKIFTTLGILTLACSAFAGQKLLISGQGWSELAIIDKDSCEIEWAYTPKPLKNDEATPQKKARNAKANRHGISVNCLNTTKDGNIAFSTGFAAVVISKDEEILWSYKAEGNQEIHSMAQLENGNYLVGICGLPSLILELDKDKNIVNKISFNAENSNVHSQFRHINKLKNGNYIVALMKTSKIIELNKAGETVNTFPMKGIMPSIIFGAVELKNGNLIISGDAGKIVEYDMQNKKVVREINNDNLNGADILFPCQVVELENGNLLVANWNGHSKDKTQPKLMEIDKDNNVVWKLPNSDRIKNLAAVHVLE